MRLLISKIPFLFSVAIFVCNRKVQHLIDVVITKNHAEATNMPISYSFRHKASQFQSESHVGNVDRTKI